GEPLQPGVEGDAVVRLRLEAADGLRCRIAVVRRPFVEADAPLAEVVVEGVEGRMRLERLAPFGAETVELLVDLAPPERRPQRLEDRQLDGPHCGVIDEVALL